MVGTLSRILFFIYASCEPLKKIFKLNNSITVHYGMERFVCHVKEVCIVEYGYLVTHDCCSALYSLAKALHKWLSYLTYSSGYHYYMMVNQSLLTTFIVFDCFRFPNQGSDQTRK